LGKKSKADSCKHHSIFSRSIEYFFFLLKEYNYQEERCQHVIETMKKCCSRNSAINTELCLGFKDELELRRVMHNNV